MIDIHSCPVCKSTNTLQFERLESNVLNSRFVGTKWICEDCGLHFTVLWDAKERLALWEGMLKMQDRIDKINRTLNKNAYVVTKHRGRISHSNMDKDQQSKCPKCKTPLYCPCKACTEREPKGLTYQDHYHWKHGEVICCPVCGYEDGCDMWV